MSATSVADDEEPPFRSYFVSTFEDRTTEQPYQEQTDSDEEVPTDSYQPRAGSPVFVSHSKGATCEAGRFTSAPNRPYRIPVWDQACMKHVFKDAFDPKIDAQEFQALGTLVISVLVNIAVVSVNVFVTQYKSSLLSATIAARIVFTVELGIVYLFMLLLLCTIFHAWWHKNVGTNIAVDLVELAQVIASFSTLKVVGFVSPQFFVARILPAISAAATPAESVKGGVMVFSWIIACVVAVLTIVVKVSQVGFASEVPINEWTFPQVLLILGLVLNLASVDESYNAEMRTLLQAVHRHYCGPGGPDSIDPQDEGLYSQLLDLIGYERGTTYEYFESVFDYHFGEGDPNSLTTKEKLKKTLNFMAFISKIDTVMLRRFLQMINSPIQYYETGRQSFSMSLKERNMTVSEVSLWRTDPTDTTTILTAVEHPQKFRQIYVCESPVDDE